MEVKEFFDAMSTIASTVFVLTTDGPAGRAGLTLTSVCSVTAERPTLLACVHHLSPAVEAVAKNGVFCVNALGEQASVVSDVFAGRSPSEKGDKFAAVEWSPSESGCPVLELAITAFECKLAEDLRWTTHHVLFGEVTSVTARGGKPLLYSRRGYRSVAAA